MVYKHVGFSCQNRIENFKRCFFCSDVVPDKMGYFDEVKYKCSSTFRGLMEIVCFENILRVFESPKSLCFLVSGKLGHLIL